MSSTLRKSSNLWHQPHQEAWNMTSTFLPLFAALAVASSMSDFAVGASSAYAIAEIKTPKATMERRIGFISPTIHDACQEPIPIQDHFREYQDFSAALVQNGLHEESYLSARSLNNVASSSS
jgi:hypothetical protein